MRTRDLLKILLLCVGSFYLNACSSDDNDEESIIPVIVEKAFVEKFPSARVLHREAIPEYYKFEFLDTDRNQTSTWFNVNGVWKTTKTKISGINMLPEAVQNAFGHSEYAWGEVEDIDKMERWNMDYPLYTLLVSKEGKEYDMYIHGSGMLLKTITHENFVNYVPFWWIETPQEVNDYMADNYSGISILGVLPIREGCIELDIMHENYFKRVFFGANGVWKSTSRELDATEQLPAHVIAFITKQYGNYSLVSRHYKETAHGVYYDVYLKNGDEEFFVSVRND